MSNYENITTGTVHAGRVRRLRADFTESGYVEWATADCEKHAAYRNMRRMGNLTPTDAPVTCRRCLALTAPAPAPVGFRLTVKDALGYSETFKNERTAISRAVEWAANTIELGYSDNTEAIEAILSATGLDREAFDKKVAAKVKAYRRESAKWAATH